MGMRLGQRPRNEATKSLGYWTNPFDIRLSRDERLNGFLEVSLEVHCLPAVLVGGDITQAPPCLAATLPVGLI